MKRKQLRFTGYFLVIGLIASLALGLAACGSKTITTTTTTLSSIAVTPASLTSLVVGSTQQFIATGTYSDGSTIDISSQVTWASDATGTATISSTGLATGVAAGTTNITAILDGITTPPISLAVVAPASTTTTTPTTTSAATLSSIAVAPASPASLAVGSTQAFTASGTYSDGSKADITSKVTWASDTTVTATISSTGLATGVAAGNANITAALSGVTSQPVSLTVMVPTSTTTSP
jgi:uncharacterized protein YjdB